MSEKEKKSKTGGEKNYAQGKEDDDDEVQEGNYGTNEIWSS